MTERERKDFVRTLRMNCLTNPKKWAILAQAADELERLMEDLSKARRRLGYFDELQLRSGPVAKSFSLKEQKR